MMKHTEWLPIGTPPQLYEDLRAMKGFKTDPARKNRKIPSIVGGTSFLALLVALIVVALTLISSLYASNLIQAIARMPSFESSKSDKPSLVPRITAASTVFSSTFVHDTPHFSNSDLRLRCYHCMSSRYSSPLTDVCLVYLFLPPAVIQNAVSMNLSTVVVSRAPDLEFQGRVPAPSMNNSLSQYKFYESMALSTTVGHSRWLLASLVAQQIQASTALSTIVIFRDRITIQASTALSTIVISRDHITIAPKIQAHI